MLWIYGSQCFSQDDPRWSDMTILYTMWYHAMALAYKLFVDSFSLLKSLLFFWIATLPNAQTKIANVYMREQSCDTRDDMMIPIWYDMYAMGGVDHTWSPSNIDDDPTNRSRTIPRTEDRKHDLSTWLQAYDLHDPAALRRPELIIAGELEGGDYNHTGLLIMRIRGRQG